MHVRNLNGHVNWNYYGKLCLVEFSVLVIINIWESFVLVLNEFRIKDIIKECFVSPKFGLHQIFKVL